MKLESLNNEKFKLATTEMSKLVGGKITVTDSSGGPNYPKGTSADRCYEYSGTDVVNGILMQDYWFTDVDDVARRDALKPNQK